MKIADIKDTQGYTPRVVFKDCWFGVKDIDDEDYAYCAVIIDNEGDIIRMKLQNSDLISDKWYKFADSYRIPEKASELPC